MQCIEVVASMHLADVVYDAGGIGEDVVMEVKVIAQPRIVVVLPRITREVPKPCDTAEKAVIRHLHHEVQRDCLLGFCIVNLWITVVGELLEAGVSASRYPLLIRHRHDVPRGIPLGVDGAGVLLAAQPGLQRMPIRPKHAVLRHRPDIQVLLHGDDGHPGGQVLEVEEVRYGVLHFPAVIVVIHEVCQMVGHHQSSSEHVGHDHQYLHL
mmetsp:Transcript_16668/g.49847  ORF Transcript_16668/g.49847 Transcript_16668/m.49847 type:complete len:210 (+) Transcript_16668:1933-2562(+)